ncbi:MAG: hypothetical protein ABIR32_15225 [Ilumatobacteraceae bacterium]
MQRPTTSTRFALIAVVLMLAVTSCGGDRSVSMPAADQLPAPTFVELPTDLADSVQLDAIVARDNAGLLADITPPDPKLLGPALAAFMALPDAQTDLTRLAIYNDSVNFTFYERGIVGRSVTAFYRLPWEDDPNQDPRLSLTDPTFADDPTFSIVDLDPTVPEQLVAALAERVPTATVQRIAVELAPEFGLPAVWTLTLSDARGQFATITADFTGAILVVSQS